MESKNAWLSYREEQVGEVMDYNEGYKRFLSEGKTERECVAYAVREARENGYRDLKAIIKNKEKLQPGDKVYYSYMDKSLLMFIIGTDPLEEGMNILGAHIDSPRIDVKCNPLYEDTELAYLDTRFYGGIKEYQWLAMPLALHGVVAKKDGTVEHVSIGEKPEDPVFGITDLLPHLAQNQMGKKAGEFIDGEALDLLVGSMPRADEEKKEERVKSTILDILKKQLGMEEADFLSSELEIVPAGKARDFGLDRSMIMSYGHDDRVCAYPSYTAMFAVEAPKRTCVCILVDKEEIGSEGATSMNSDFFKNAVAELVNCLGEYSGLTVKRALANSRMLSYDVTAAYDPLYGEVSEKKNTAYLGRGLAFCKYTGGSGKARSNDANAEYIAALRRVLDEADVRWQMTELGRVGVGGGGTIAKFVASYGMDVIDSGVPVLSMHAPWEVVSKADVYEAYRGYVAFLKNS